eukprot:1136510-Pelagomonas_calceolata.AAC.1
MKRMKDSEILCQAGHTRQLITSIILAACQSRAPSNKRLAVGPLATGQEGHNLWHKCPCSSLPAGISYFKVQHVGKQKASPHARTR